MSIRMEGLTKTFSNGKGIFNLSFSVQRGEILGYLGPNGAGKSTTIRHLMGFYKPDRGKASIDGLDCTRQSAEIMKKVGYLPGEIAFPEGMTGLQILELLGGMRGMKNASRRDQLIGRFQFDVKTPIRKMSKGMKQKVGIVAAFMHDPEILILDEPTSGLDPLMQQLFIELVLEEKERGKTVLMSSHIFDEIERTCDRVGIIKDGKLIAVEEVGKIQAAQRKIIAITFRSKEDMDAVKQSGLEWVKEEGLKLHISVQGNYERLVAALAGRGIVNMDVESQKLEDVFMHFYGGKEEVSR
ncbi:ABC transporter ATP-binding protein [Paenibacillus macerans]|uniref:ABC transporter ATP-binding protein n=1 Tax=Paenibacillus macerans TaxID=44252 RepID=UPI003D31932F